MYSPSAAFYVLTTAHLPRKIFDILQKLFDLLQNSTIANRESTDPKQRFWKRYRAVAEAFDNEFLKRYREDMDVSMIFVCDATLLVMKLCAYMPPGWSFLRRLRDVPHHDEA